MERILSKKLKKWKESRDRKPLVLKGARQVGKTYLLQKFGEENYKNTIYLNLENASSDIVSLFDGDLSPTRIITSLEIYFGEKILPGETLIIFDEVQEVPRALTSLKYFCEKAPQFHIAVAGSLLGLYLHSGTSFPVGKVDFLHLEPMNFEEFLAASGESKLLEQIKSSREILFPDKLKDYFQYYLVTGGMPEVVASWIDERNIEKVEKIQDNILSSYVRDFSQHADIKTAMKIRQVWDTLTSQFAKENDKFLWGVIKKGARAREYKTAVQWLVDGGLVRRVDRVKIGDKLPLKAYIDNSAFKLYFVDVGLFRRLAQIPTAVVLEKNAIFNEFNGLIAEQFVLQNMQNSDVFYWTSEAQSEVDFVIQHDKDIVPLEVKSGDNVKAKSLKVYREKYKPRLSIRFSMRKLQITDGLLNMPLYAVFLMPELLDHQG